MKPQAMIQQALDFLKSNGMEDIDLRIEVSYGSVTIRCEHEDITKSQLRAIKAHFGGVEIIEQSESKGLKGSVSLGVDGELNDVDITVNKAYSCKLITPEEAAGLDDAHWEAIKANVQAGRIKITDCTPVENLAEPEEEA